MARQRMLHPGFFTDADLCECSPLARLLFAGLWTVADREGRLEDRPRELKVKILPFDDCQIEPLLAELTRVNAIQRYEVDGAHYISIPNFLKYQHPHQRETPSTFPKAPTQPGKGSARPLPSPEKAMTSRAESVTESVTVTKSVTESVVPRARKKPRVAAPEQPTDPRHAPTVKLLADAFEVETRAKYPFTGRDAKAVTQLLALAIEPTIEATWRKALRSTGYPLVRTLPELVTHFAHFVGKQATGPPTGAASASATDWSDYQPGDTARELFGDKP